MQEKEILCDEPEQVDNNVLLRAASLVSEANNTQTNTNDKLINELNSLNLDESSSSKNETAANASTNNAANDLIDFGFLEPTVSDSVAEKVDALNGDEDEDLRLALKLQEEEEVHQLNLEFLFNGL